MKPRSSTLWATLFSIAFLAVSFHAVYNAFRRAEQGRELQHEETRKELESLWKVWEKNIFVQLDSWHTTLESQERPQQLEAIWKKQVPWLQDIYIWEEQELLYPQVIWNDISAPCLNENIEIFNCQNESLEVQNRASLWKTQKLLQQGQIQEAQFSVLSAHPALRSNLFDLNFSPSAIQDFILRRNLLYKTEQLNAPLNGGHSLLGETLKDLNSLPSPFVKVFLEDINRNSTNISEESAQQIEKQHRRLESFQELQSLEKDALETDSWKVHISSYQENPNLILLRQNEDGQTVAIVLESFALLQDILQESLLHSLSVLTVVNANGQPIFPHKFSKENGTFIQVPGNQLFPHLRLDLQYLTASENIWSSLLNQLIPIGIAGSLGIFALFGVFQAERKQREFISRQQAFIARVTHEFKTPLAGIQLMAESLQMGMMKNPEQAMQFVARILVETARLEKRIDEVLQVAKKAEMKRKELIDAEMLMLELYDVWQERFQEVNGTLRLERTPIEFFGDLDLIRDAISNLLSNSIKYRQPNRPLRCIFAIELRGSWVEISVSDNGIGVPIIERKRIFERFVRVESSHRGFAGGHGLGLAFVAETAEAHKGTVRCTDGFDGGTKFLFRIPNG